MGVLIPKLTNLAQWRGKPNTKIPLNPIKESQLLNSIEASLFCKKMIILTYLQEKKNGPQIALRLGTVPLMKYFAYLQEFNFGIL